MQFILRDVIRTSGTGKLLGICLLAIAAVAAGCTTRAEPVKQNQAPAAKKESAATTQTPGNRINEDPYSERQFDGDLEYSTPAPQKESLVLTKAAYESIKTGMTLDAVEKLLGGRGMLVSTMDVNGRKTQIYKWSNDDFSRYIDVTLEGGKVVEKKDKGLK